MLSLQLIAKLELFGIGSDFTHSEQTVEIPTVTISASLDLRGFLGFRSKEIFVNSCLCLTVWHF